MSPAPRAFDDVTDEPCPVCLDLAMAGQIQARGVMPLPSFPAMSRLDGRKCCRDCQATDSGMAAGFQHPSFAAARLTVANERIEAMLMPRGLAEHFGMTAAGWLRPCSVDDFDGYIDWLESQGIPNSCSQEPFAWISQSDIMREAERCAPGFPKHNPSNQETDHV